MEKSAIVLLGLETGLLRGLDSLKWTIEHLQEKIEIMAVSTIIQGFSTSDYQCLKVVIKVTVLMSPEELLGYLQTIETDYSDRKEFMEPLRCYLMVYDQQVSMTPQLLLPHPQMVNDPGWLYCAWEVWRNYRHPVLEFSLEKLLADIQMTNVQFFSQAKSILSKQTI